MHVINQLKDFDVVLTSYGTAGNDIDAIQRNWSKQDAHKIMQKKARRDSTILPHAGNIDNLHNAHTSSSTNQPFLNQFAVPENPIRTRPTTMQTANVHCWK